MARRLALVVPFLALMILLCLSAESAASDTEAQSPQQQAVPNTVQLLRLMDRDHSGTVSRAEYDKFMNQEFDMLDVDHNGELDTNELSKFHLENYLAAQLLPLMDKDRDGKVSRAEFMRFMDQEFDRLDVNKNGELDVGELAQMRHANATAR
jgi:Ca2+-binding EF-hand superfamily protein